MRISDWSSDVCSSDLGVHRPSVVLHQCNHALAKDELPAHRMTPPVNPLALRRLRYARPGVERDARYDNAGAVYPYRLRTDNLDRLAVHRCELVPQAMGRRLYRVRTHGGCPAQ